MNKVGGRRCQAFPSTASVISGHCLADSLKMQPIVCAQQSHALNRQDSYYSNLKSSLRILCHVLVTHMGVAMGALTSGKIP